MIAGPIELTLVEGGWSASEPLSGDWCAGPPIIAGTPLAALLTLQAVTDGRCPVLVSVCSVRAGDLQVELHDMGSGQPADRLQALVATAKAAIDQAQELVMPSTLAMHEAIRATPSTDSASRQSSADEIKSDAEGTE